MGDIQIRTDFDVTLLDHMGDDQSICQAARVSVQGADSVESGEASGLINYLMKHRHGSPFEHGALKFLITQPIFSWREFMRHRIGFSYNEQSARYMEMQPVFYVPPTERGIVNEATSARPKLVQGTDVQRHRMLQAMVYAYQESWGTYQIMLRHGVAKEVARSVLPVATYSSAYVTCNPRSLMAFLSLRTHDENATFVSYPQWEIAEVARQIESAFAEKFPLTHRAFLQNGRVAP